MEDVIRYLPMPLLISRGGDDRLSTSVWARDLDHRAPQGRDAEVDGAHTFVWKDPWAWSEPIRALVGGRPI